ncbi:TldD/PmbA family protein [Paenibacillus sp. MER TA 81-3]|uniref:TldD/PmbA family protein n=1 Tax=Paenibacillus sp. MER TA 81-3 TaxID=2939573 RepID=UPI002041BF6A|nr:TldD/PmbA family protein [Paenibacillus sp. MER TA 81-3]MCM3340493.1 TldD/PmbA family protein [Paenibacillus sp. MER TA 81-3]
MLHPALIENMLTAALATGGDFAEVFVEDKTANSLGMIGGIVESALSGRDYGVGIRIINGLFAVYAYTNDCSEDNLIKVATSAAQAIRGQVKDITIDLRRTTIPNQHVIQFNPSYFAKARKIEWMRRAHSAAKDYSPVISQTSITLTDSVQNVCIANSEGLLVEDCRTYTRMGFNAIAEAGATKQSGYLGPGAYAGMEFIETMDIERYAREAARIATTMVNAKYAPSGKLPVIIDNGFGGVIFHEACGHGLEATSVAKKASVFADKLGEQVASPLVTAIDDGTIPNAWGSLNIDDEGAPTQRNVLIENGILKSYLIDKLGGLKMGMASTGSGRRQSYQFAPTSRMNNTFIAAGDSTTEEIIANTEYGLYAKYMGGGSVNTATGEFNFAVNEGYIVRNGKIEEPVKGATLIGKGIETLQKIDMVGDNLDHGQGMCGSLSGSIPVNCGQPMIRVSEMTVGGRKGE